MRPPSLLAPCLASLAVRALSFAVAAAFLLRLSPFPDAVAWDVNNYLRESRAVCHGLVPYGEVFIEYPPGFLLAAVPPYLVADALGGEPLYAHAFAAWMSIWEVLLTWLVGRCAWEITGDRRRATLAAWLYALSFVCAGFATTRFDAVPAVFLMAALWGVSRARPLGAAGLSAAGALVKWFPGVLIGPMVEEELRLGRRRGAFARLGVWLLVLAAGAAPAAIASPRGFVASYAFFLRVDPQSSTTHKLLSELGTRTGLWHLAPAAFTWPLAAAQFGCWAAIAAWLWRRPAPWTPRTHVAAAVGLLVPFLLCNKVFSPQYLLWVAAPFCVLARTRLDWVLYFALQGVVVIEFPLLYSYYPNDVGLGVAMGLRCLLLAAIAIRALRR